MPHVAVSLTFKVHPAEATDSGFDAIADHLWDVEDSDPNLHDSGVEADLGLSQLGISITSSQGDFLSASNHAQNAILTAIARAGFAVDVATVRDGIESITRLELVSQTADLVEAMQIA